MRSGVRFPRMRNYWLLQHAPRLWHAWNDWRFRRYFRQLTDSQLATVGDMLRAFVAEQAA